MRPILVPKLVLLFFVYIMAVLSAAEMQWKSLFEKHTHLPPAFDRVHTAHDISTPFCIGLKSVEGLTQRVSKSMLI